MIENTNMEDVVVRYFEDLYSLERQKRVYSTLLMAESQENHKGFGASRVELDRVALSNFKLYQNKLEEIKLKLDTLHSQYNYMMDTMNKIIAELNIAKSNIESQINTQISEYKTDKENIENSFAYKFRQGTLSLISFLDFMKLKPYDFSDKEIEELKAGHLEKMHTLNKQLQDIESRLSRMNLYQVRAQARVQPLYKNVLDDEDIINK